MSIRTQTLLGYASAGVLFCVSFGDPGAAASLWPNLTTAPTKSVAISSTTAQQEKARRVLDLAIAYLRTQQDKDTGGWSVHKAGVTFPAITALVIDGMLADPALDATDPAIAKGIDFLLSYRQPNGGIYDRILPNYNTSIALSALARANTPKANAAIADAQAFLTGLQWSEDSLSPETSQELGVGKVTPDHPFYGGVGYGKHGRPDLSNLSFMLQALHDSGYDAEGPAVRRALVFLERVQMDSSINDMPYAKSTQQGGFIYATSSDEDHIGNGQSQAGLMDETLDDGTLTSSLRCYGSMTYAGFKSYMYAELGKDDPRVKTALGWIERNYTLKENPGLGDQGYYYYLATFARAMQAWNEPVIDTIDAQGKTHPHRWAEDLINALESLQEPDGSFAIKHDRWLENDPVLVTAYSVIALQAGLHEISTPPTPPTTPTSPAHPAHR